MTIGNQIRRADGRLGQVEALEFVLAPQPMYNLTVAEAHTYFVGQGRWLVHNTCDPYEVGTYKDLVAKSDVGDGLDIHHLPQKHPAGQVIDGYDPNTGTAIALPQGEHRSIPTMRGEYTGTSQELIKGNFDDLNTHTNAPEEAIKKLTDLIDEKYPGAR